MNENGLTQSFQTPAHTSTVTRFFDTLDESPSMQNGHHDEPPVDTSRFSCELCPRSFTRRENLRRHLNSHDISRAHCCHVCGKGFSRTDLLRRHVAGHPRWDKETRTRGQSSSKTPPSIRSIELDKTTKSSNVRPTRHNGDDYDLQFNAHMSTTNHRDTTGPDNELSTASYSHTLDPGLSNSSRDNSNVQLSDDTSLNAWPSDLGGINQLSDHPQYLNTTHQGYDGLQRLNSGANMLGHTSQTQAEERFEESQLMQSDFPAFFLTSGDMSNEWFSHDFYSAMGETQYDFPSYSYEQFSNTVETESIWATGHEYQNRGGFLNRNDVTTHIKDNVETEIRMSSPPNEESEEDKWPFAWNPNSRGILQANPVSIPIDHILRKAHNSTFDISEATLLNLKEFLTAPNGRELHMSQRSTVMLPSLAEINIFIGLFFTHFSLQMPVLHHATIDTNRDLPPPLVGVMIVIGAIYSRLLNTRRFAIVLLDIVRWHLQIALECNNSLMREPIIIYAEALICHAGLWCGNKRSFELAEVVRAGVVKHLRTLNSRNGEPNSRQPTINTHPDDDNETTKSIWRQWIVGESQKRLSWVVYTLDCQFSSLLNLPATIAISELTNLSCPCDDEFWYASSAQAWKNLFGLTPAPPCLNFALVAAPFVCLGSPKIMLSNSATHVSREMDGQLSGAFQVSTSNPNPWTAFLVLITIQCQIFQFSQESLFVESAIRDAHKFDIVKAPFDVHGSSHSPINDSARSFQSWQKAKREQFYEILSNWAIIFQDPPAHKVRSPSSTYFQNSALILHRLATVNLNISLTHLQNAMGKEGKDGILRAISSLEDWKSTFPELSEDVTYHAIQTIVFLSNDKLVPSAPDYQLVDTAPYSIITLFICYLVFWAYVNLSNAKEKHRLLIRITESEKLASSSLFIIFVDALMAKDELTVQNADNSQNAANKVKRSLKAQKIIFKCAAKMLTDWGTWGASLNLALLLYNRAEL